MEGSLPDERGASSYLENELFLEQKSKHFIEFDNSTEQEVCVHKELMHHANVGQFSRSGEADQILEHVVPYPNDAAEMERDIGYSSHSTCSSCNVDSIQMDQGSQVGYGPNNVNVDWSDIECDNGCLHGENEVEDLLYHFDKFFRSRFESEMLHLQDSIHNMLTEQQIHVRQIVNTALKSCVSSGQEELSPENAQKFQDDYIKNTELERQSPLPNVIDGYHSYKPARSPVPTSSLLNSPFCQCEPEYLRGHFKQHTEHSYKKTEEEESSQLQSKDKLLLRLLTLTCSISSLLQKKEYKT